MAIKALKQSVSTSEMQKIIHQWRAKGISDSAVLKLLDLYLGLTPYMTADGVYPMRNLYQICQCMKTTHTTTLLENIRKCNSFGFIWDASRTNLLGFYSPLWSEGLKKDTPQTLDPVASVATPVASPASTVASPATTDNSILYNINNIYPPEDSPKGYPAGSEAPKTSPAKDFFHQLNVNPREKQQVLLPLIDSIAARHNYTRPRASEALVILVNEILIPYFDGNPQFLKTSHAGRIVWLQNLLKTRHGDTLMQQAVQKLNKSLLQDLEKKRKKRREFRPVSPFEWKDPDKDLRYYDDPLDGKVELPADAPPRPTETAVWNIISQEWVG